MNANQLSEIIRLHRLWLDGADSGVLADLRYVDLSNADLRGANLSNADLSNADLRYADLRYANLSNADLSNADLRYAIGNGSIIRTIQTGVYVVVICGQSVSIGCQSHDWSDWMMFNDTSIHNMDGQNAVDFWRIWRPILTAIMEVR